MTDPKRESQDLAQEIITWARTEEGQQKLSAANENSKNVVNELRRRFIVDSEMLNTAFH